MNSNEIIGFLERAYPPNLALSWDNVGLQVGHHEREIHQVGITLTLTPEILEEVIQKNIQFVVTHHPLFFQPLKRIDLSKPSGMMLEKLIQHNITVYSLHTNLDIARHGVSDELAKLFGIKQSQVMEITSQASLYKLVVYVPCDDFETFRSNMLGSRVGHIGDYSHCSFSMQGEGTFKPGEGASPYIGSTGELSKVAEFRFETIVHQRDCEKVIADMKKYHPYEEVAYDLFELSTLEEPEGLGRHGIVTPINLSEWEFPIQGTLKGNTDLK
ncbi:MAG: Nif3-like dinuclear metal center hexameric protein, partial [Candidatus Margulisiibacteriota bacterium]